MEGFKYGGFLPPDEEEEEVLALFMVFSDCDVTQDARRVRANPGLCECAKNGGNGSLSSLLDRVFHTNRDDRKWRRIDPFLMSKM